MDVSNNPLDSTEFLERLRADWAKQCNLMLPEGVRIDHRSLEAQGIERIPTIHEGHASREITKRGGHSILNAINRRIATANRYLTPSANRWATRPACSDNSRSRPGRNSTRR